MEFSEVERLLDPGPMALEMGYERFANGVAHVAVRTDMHGCTGEMIEWWFRFRPDTEKYIWFHPIDHVSSDWIGGSDETHVGSTHLVEEFCTGLPAAKISIQFRDSKEFFPAEAYGQARGAGAVTAAVCARVGFSHAPERDEGGAVLGSRLMHIGRDTPWGCALRQHFYLGQDLPDMGMSPADVVKAFPDVFAEKLMMHAYDEFTFLSRFLPSLFLAENRATRPVRQPW